MKLNIILLIIILNYNCFSQSVQTGTTQETLENVNTDNNVSTINLYELDFNGSKIPIRMIYDHSGVKVNSKRNNLGTNWRIDDIGFIKTIVNDYPDSNITKGWFNTPETDLTTFVYFGNCSDGCPQYFGEHDYNDLSPDFFSCSIINGLNFDFLFKKNVQGSLPIPVFMSNPDNSIINTNFGNFSNNSSSTNTNIVFNIIDKFGNNYDFINGPNLFERWRYTNQIFRNNFYLKTIKNYNQTETLNIDYEPYILQDQTFYKEGYYSGSSSDFNLNIIPSNYTQEKSYDVDYSRLNIKSITTNNNLVNFSYNTSGLYTGMIDEIEIKDSFGNYIQGFKFIYNEQTDGVLYKILKFNNDKSQSMVIYEFEYFEEQAVFFNNHGQHEDNFGYLNAVYKENTLPFKVRLSNTQIIPAGNYLPNINYAKWSSLKKIKSIYGGTIEFDYDLKYENHEHFGPIYGGGLVLFSKKLNPNIGKSKITIYNHSELSGFLIMPSLYNHHNIMEYNGKKFYSQKPFLDELNEVSNTDPLYMQNSHNFGSYFKTTSETNYDYDEYITTGNWNYSIRKEFITNCEGIYRKPLLKKQIEMGINGYHKIIEYNYDLLNLETINSSKYNFYMRYANGIVYLKNKTLNPIRINRFEQQSKKETILGFDLFEKIEYYDYENVNSKSIKKILTTSSNGNSLEKNFFYTTNLNLVNEPLRNELLAKNIIGIPLKIETYYGTEKTSEQKTVFANDVSTNNLLLPKFIYAKKGTDANATLEKKLTYNLYDDKGNVLQYTQENGVSNVIIWGYNKTEPIAEIQNIAYSNITSYVTNLQSLSNADNDTCISGACNEQLLRNALNSLRTTLASSYPNARMTTYTYNPLNGVTSVTDAKSDVYYYIYDSFQRLIKVIDKDGKIVNEKEYNYKPQN